VSNDAWTGLTYASCGNASPPNSGGRSAEFERVTVLFADVVHSMDIAATVGPERLREIMTKLVDHAGGASAWWRRRLPRTSRPLPRKASSLGFEGHIRWAEAL